MRRKDKQIIQREKIDEIIKNATVCRIAMAVDNIPYIIPISFGYNGENIYIHTAKEGKKIDFWEKNNTVCFEFETDIKTISHESIPCKWTTAYKSIIGYGEILEITGFEEKTKALNHIMKQYSGKNWEFTEEKFKNVRMWRIKISSISGKKSNY